MAITTSQMQDIILRTSASMEENKQHLTNLDAAIGDGDHGINMARGFHAVKEKLEGGEFSSVGELLKAIGMTLLSSIGGASGPLYGTFFLKAATPAMHSETVTMKELSQMFTMGVEGVKVRGKSQQGEKTMLDVLIPVQQALALAVENRESSEKAVQNIMSAAKTGLEYTKTIAATKGRASYLGERSIGHVDPGAMSSYLLIEEFVADYINKNSV